MNTLNEFYGCAGYPERRILTFPDIRSGSGKFASGYPAQLSGIYYSMLLSGNPVKSPDIRQDSGYPVLSGSGKIFRISGPF